MYEKIKTVYYCSYCTRHTLTKGSILKHEKICYKNPDRSCPECGAKNSSIIESAAEMLVDFNNGKWPGSSKEIFSQLMELYSHYFEDCTCCIRYIYVYTELGEHIVGCSIDIDDIVKEIKKMKYEEFLSVVGYPDID